MIHRDRDQPFVSHSIIPATLATIPSTSLLLACGLALVGACAPELCVGDCDGGTAGSTQDELASLRACTVQSTIDDSTCGDGVAQPGELCFEPGVIIPLPGNPYTAIAGDFDGDGRTDVLWSDEDGTVLRMPGASVDPLSMIVASTQIDPEHPLLHLTGTGDFDGDGVLDAVGSDDRAVLLRGLGDGGFEPFRLIYDSNTISWGPTVLDADGDADLDLAIIDPSAALDNLVLANDGAGLFSVVPQFEDEDPGTRTPIALGDLDGSGPFDRVTGIDDTLRLDARSGAGLTSSWLSLAADYLHAVDIEIHDLDGDGHSDLVLGLLDAEHENGELVLVYNSVAVLLASGPPVDGSPAFDPGTYLPMDCSAFELAMGDMDGDGALDIVTSHYAEPTSGQSASIVVRRGDGLGGFDDVARVPAPVGVDQGGEVLLGDFDGDGRQDVAVFIRTGAQVVLYRGRS